MNAYKKDINIYTEELETVKKKYFDKKRLEMAGHPVEDPEVLSRRAVTPAPLPHRNLGGGYNAALPDSATPATPKSTTPRPHSQPLP